MKAIRYRRSVEHTTVISIDNKDVIVHSAIVHAIKSYKEDFRQLCKQFYKDGDKNPAIKTGIKDYKHSIRDYKRILDALANTVITSDRDEARTLATTLF